MQDLGVRQIVLTGVMIAVVAVFTRAIVINIGIGYFNFSDVAVYFAGFAFGPWIGLIAGGGGTALADLSLGYGQWAPLSFAAHGLEGWVAGYLGYKIFPQLTESKNPLWRFLLALGWIPFTIFIAVYILVKVLLGDEDELSQAISTLLEQRAQIPGMGFGWMLGAVVMVALYFLGEYFVPIWGGPPQAVTEWLPNMVQAIAGALVGIPLTLAVRRAYPPITQWAQPRA